MNLLHFSDCHGRVPTWMEGTEHDLVVCSGDLLPDRYPRKVERERMNLPYSMPGSPAFQEQWLRTQRQRFTDLVRGKPFLFCPGNHDFFDPVPVLREWGIEAYNLSEKVVEVAGWKFYGFPFIPWAGGAWNYEVKPPAMHAKMMAMLELLYDEAFDVLVAHCPPFGVLDIAKDTQRYGNMMMWNAFKAEDAKRPHLYLCGHIHASRGMSTVGDMPVSNAATTKHVLILPDRS
jgi:Icc-related predicted phosphoesterase